MTVREKSVSKRSDGMHRHELGVDGRQDGGRAIMTIRRHVIGSSFQMPEEERTLWDDCLGV